MRIFKRGKYWWIDFTYRGRRYRYSLRTTQKKIAEEILRDTESKIARGEFLGEVEDVPFEEFLDHYLAITRRQKSPKGFEQDLNASKHLRKYFGGISLSLLTPESIERYKTYRLSTGVKPVTVNRDLQVLRAMLNKAVRWGYLRENPMKTVKLYPEPPSRVRYLSQDEIRRLLKVSKGYLRVLIYLALTTGMRKGELLSLTWKQVDLLNGYVHLEETKTRRRRSIPLPPETVEILESWKAHRAPRDPGKRVFPVKDFKRSWRTALKRAGIEDFRFHDLRHTFASHLVMSGVDLRTLSELLGHKTLRMVQRYSHIGDEQMRDAVRTITRKVIGGVPLEEVTEKVVGDEKEK